MGRRESRHSAWLHAWLVIPSGTFHFWQGYLGPHPNLNIWNHSRPFIHPEGVKFISYIKVPSLCHNNKVGGKQTLLCGPVTLCNILFYSNRIIYSHVKTLFHLFQNPVGECLAFCSCPKAKKNPQTKWRSLSIPVSVRILIWLRCFGMTFMFKNPPMCLN